VSYKLDSSEYARAFVEIQANIQLILSDLISCVFIKDGFLYYVPLFVMKKCMYCGKEFKPRKNGANSHFCSKECGTKHIIRSAKAFRANRRSVTM